MTDSALGTVSGVTYQETVRAHLATLHPHLIDETITVTDGTISLTERPGIRARWLPELFENDRAEYRMTQ